MQDKCVKVWDMRNFKCVQSIADREPYKPDDTIAGLLYDGTRGRLVTGNTRLKAWRLETAGAAGGVGGHCCAVCQVLYNATFGDVVSADRGGTVCIWNAATGALRFRCATSAAAQVTHCLSE